MDTITGERIVVVSYEGVVNEFTSDGQLSSQWQLESQATKPALAKPALATLTLGPSFGGGALWLGDEHGSIFRLGTPLSAQHGK
jgi:hypothetical protein